MTQLDADGGTEMAGAIELALGNQPEQPRGSLRQVVFITDGAVGNEDALFRQISSTLGASRLFTVGIGSAPNSYFMRKAAQFGRGTFTYIGATSEVAGKMSELFTQLQSPVLRDIKVDWPGTATMYPQTVPDLYQGQPLVVTARLDRPVGYRDSGVRISGSRRDGEWKQLLRLNSGDSAQHAGVGTLWARARIAALEDRLIAEGETDDVRSAIVDVALLHRLVSRYTSFVAVDKTPVRPADSNLRTRQVPNARPAGQADQPFAYPQTATRACSACKQALLCLALAAQVWWLRRRDLRRRAVAGAQA